MITDAEKYELEKTRLRYFDVTEYDLDATRAEHFCADFLLLRVLVSRKLLIHK
jgi:hypothetical protein